MKTANRMERLAAWTALLASTDAAGLASIGTGMVDWYRSGGSGGDEELAWLHFREGQLTGSTSLDATMPREPNGNLSLTLTRRMRGWASADPAAAKAWIDQREEGSVKQTMLSAWFEGAIDAHPAQAATLYAQVPESGKTSTLMPLIDSLHREKGMDGVVAWFQQATKNPAAGVPLQPAFDKLTWRLGQMGQFQPEAVLSVMRDPTNAPWLNATSITNATRQMAGNAPGRIIELVAEISGRDESLQEDEVRQILRSTVRNSSGSTINNLGNWLKQNPTHSLHDLTVRYFVEQAAREDPAAAAAWAGKIRDPDLKAEITNLIIP